MREKALREQYQLTMQQVAALIGTTPEVLCEMEAGNPPDTLDVSHLHRLSDLFDVSADYLMGKRDKP